MGTNSREGGALMNILIIYLNRRIPISYAQLKNKSKTNKQSPFTPAVITVISVKVFIVFIDWIISKMHEKLILQAKEIKINSILLIMVIDNYNIITHTVIIILTCTLWVHFISPINGRFLPDFHHWGFHILLFPCEPTCTHIIIINIKKK